MDAQEYSYETFDAAYNADPALKNIVDNYNGQEIVLIKDKEVAAKAKEVAAKAKGKSDVKKMAKRATDLKDLN